MEGQATVGRGIAALGIVLAFVAIWVRFITVPSPAKYWDDGTFGGLLLILAILAALALAGAISTGDRNYDIAVGAIGGIGFGLYLFFPGVYAFDQWKYLDSGAWLGLCSGLTFVGAAIATWDSERPVRRPGAGGMLLAFGGLALVIAGLFPSFRTGNGSYWNIHGAGHSYGILLIILVVLEALAIGGAYSMAAGMDNAVMLGGVVLGATLAIPVGNAFNHFGVLDTGAWLAGFGGILVAVGVGAMWQLSEEPLPTRTAAPPAT
jgi:hypothetical protein